jgi:hypothetical protein
MCSSTHPLTIVSLLRKVNGHLTTDPATRPDDQAHLLIWRGHRGGWSGERVSYSVTFYSRGRKKRDTIR